MVRPATDTHSDTIEYDHALNPAMDAKLPDFGKPKTSRVADADSRDHASFEAHDFGGREDR
jgi:hypothetical protein